MKSAIIKPGSNGVDLGTSHLRANIDDFDLAMPRFQIAGICCEMVGALKERIETAYRNSLFPLVESGRN